jgi:intracellular multiplication protein IcmK
VITRSLLLAGLALAMPALAWAQDEPGQGGQQAAQPAFPAPPGSAQPNFDAALKNSIPLTPDMINQLAHQYDSEQQAVAAAQQPVTVVPQTRTVQLSFGPGTVTNIVQTVQGYPSSLAFIDSSGQPWPIAWEGNSAPGAGGSQGVCSGGSDASQGGPAVISSGFDICVPYQGSNVLEIVPQSRYPKGGLLVNLKGAPAPLTFMLMSGGGTYDARILAQVNQAGPNATPDIVATPPSPETGAPYLTAMLDGTPPSDAVPLAVTGVSPDDVRAWRYQGQIFILTSDTILSPEWVASEHSVGGEGIYALPDTPVVLMSAGGAPFSVSFKDD